LPAESERSMRAVRIGVAGPVGTGKSSLIAVLCRALSSEFEIGVVTNDIYTDEDARFLREQGVLAPDRIGSVQTGCCPHTAIRDDISANLIAVEELEHAQGPLDLVFVESGGDNLTAAFSPALADVQMFVLDTAGGDDVPRKGGPGIARSDVLVINKVDLAEHVGASVELMVADACAQRGERPVIALSARRGQAVEQLSEWVRSQHKRWRLGLLESVDPGPPAPHSHSHEHN
jgi:urease accessory protein